MENVLCFSAFHWPRKENVSDFSWDCFVLLESTQCLYIDFHWDVPVSEGLFYASLQHHQWEIYIMQWLVCKSWVNPPNTGMLRDRSTDEEKETVRRDKRDPETERVGDGHDALSLWISITASNRGGICLLRSFPTSSLLSYFFPLLPLHDWVWLRTCLKLTLLCRAATGNFSLRTTNQRQTEQRLHDCVTSLHWKLHIHFRLNLW